MATTTKKAAPKKAAKKAAKKVAKKTTPHNQSTGGEVESALGELFLDEIAENDINYQAKSEEE